MLPVKPYFDSFDKYGVSGYEEEEHPEKQRRHRDERKRLPQRTKRQEDGDHDDQKERERKFSARTAPPKGHPVRTDTEDDDDLGKERLEKPSGLKERRVCPKDVKEDAEGEEVEE